MDFFTSDTHFNAERTLELSKRPFKSVEDMNNALVDNWNAIVGKDDHVYHLGDFGDYEFAQKLNGHIHLIFGNYEHNDVMKGIVTMDRLNELFASVSMRNVNEYKSGDETFNLVHEPSNSDFNNFTLFGHIHRTQMVKRNGLNVGTDCHWFTPLSLDDVLWQKNGIQNHYDHDVFMIGKE